MYEVYTYAANINGIAIDTPVTIPEAIGPMTQVVTGPMPGNGFAYLVTHSVHFVDALDGDFKIILVQPPFEHTNQFVNGFQIVPAPEPLSGVSLIGFLCLLALRQLRRPYKRAPALHGRLI